MKTSDAQFLLSACRPDGRDAGDPLFAEALAQARQDPILRDWLAREQAVDTAIAARLATIAPPAALRDAILVGARASQPQPNWWLRLTPIWLAAAAAVVLIGSILLLRGPGSAAQPAMRDFASAAMRDLAVDSADHLGHVASLAAVEAKVANLATTVPAALAGFDLAQLQAGDCRSIKIGGHEVFELCFTRDGKWFHLYAARQADFLANANAMSAPSRFAQDKIAAASWSDGRNLYALVTDAGPDTLSRAL